MGEEHQNKGGNRGGAPYGGEAPSRLYKGPMYGISIHVWIFIHVWRMKWTSE